MISVKVYYLLALLVLVSYATLATLNQFEWFKKYEEAGVNYAFESVLALVALFTGITGIWVNGYREGLKHGKATRNKTESE